MTRPLLSPRMAEVVALLDTASAPMTQVQIATVLGVTHSSACHLMNRAIKDELAVITSGQQHRIGFKGTTANYYARSTATPPAPRYRPSTMEKRQGEALARLAEHPEGLTQAKMNTLTGWGHSAVTDCMYTLEKLGKVFVSGGTARRPKTYALLTFGTPALAARTPTTPRPPLPRTLAPVRSDLGGELEAAYKILATLSNKTAKGLQHRGGYGPRRAQELFEQLQAGGWA